ncbi:MAG: T9SS type A sorting domain-containing protein [Bacteroidota bacterium]
MKILPRGFCLLLSSLLLPTLHAQLQGGASTGFAYERFLGTLTGQAMMGRFSAGDGDGFSHSITGGSLNGENRLAIYASGAGDGFNQARFLGSLDGREIIGMFRAGFGDGYDHHQSTATPLTGVSFPIALLSFDAFPEEEYVLLKWATESELNHDFFTIERSEDAASFEDLILTPGAGNSYSLRLYEEKDLHPLSGTSYYRLKSTDFDGTFRYSHIVEVNRQQSLGWEMKLFPNPNSGRQIHVIFSGMVAEAVRLEMMDISGRILLSKRLDVQEVQAKYTLPLPEGISAGSYLIRAQSADGQISKLLIIR